MKETAAYTRSMCSHIIKCPMMKSKYILIFVLLFSSGCSGLKFLQTKKAVPEFELESYLEVIETNLQEAEKSLAENNLEKSRALCDCVIEKLFEIKPVLEENEYERLHSEAARLRLKINNSAHSQAALIKSDLFPLVWNNRVEKWINYYTGRGRNNFTKWIERSAKYIDDVKKILAENNLPFDLAYVPIIESGYYPFARSKAGALGLWQFMEATAKYNGLKINYWYDERMDPYKATKAAAHMLQELYDEFGTWELALAGYNYGPNGVRRRVRKWGTDDYWALYLPRETEDFVPKIMAAIFIIREPELFGFEPFYRDDYQWKEFEVSDCVDLRHVAEWSRVNIREIQMLNPELKRMCTPPGETYKIRIPSEAYDRFEQKFLSLKESEKYLSQAEINKRIRRVVYYRVRNGDSLWKIARKFNVSTYKIKKWNNLSSNVIYPRQTLKIYRHGI